MRPQLTPEKSAGGLIVMVCRNAVELTRQCLPTLLAQDGEPQILVVDNASTDGTNRYLASQQSRHPRLFRMHYNSVTSVARCWNEGLFWAWGRGHEEALVVNNDTELLPPTYRLLREYLATHPEAGMITAVGVDKNPTLPPPDFAARPHPDYSCFMIRRKTHRMVPFDQHYAGAYCEDADHHIRLHRAHIWAGSIPLGFLHRSSGTLKHASMAERTRILHYFRANKERFLKTYGCVPGSPAYARLFEG